MNLRRARSPEGRPSTNTSIGLVRLSNAEGLLAQKTDRNGYIENAAFYEVRRVCTDALDWAARIKIRERDARRQAAREAIKKSKGQAEARLANVIESSVRSTERGKSEQAKNRTNDESGKRV